MEYFPVYPCVFGKFFHRKFRCLAHLGGIQTALQNRPSRRLELLEEVLRKELTDTLEQEEVFWRQKSRVTWLKEGERNTHLFHMSTLGRRRQNHITHLQIEGDT